MALHGRAGARVWAGHAAAAAAGRRRPRPAAVRWRRLMRLCAYPGRPAAASREVPLLRCWIGRPTGGRRSLHKHPQPAPPGAGRFWAVAWVPCATWCVKAVLLRAAGGRSEVHAARFPCSGCWYRQDHHDGAIACTRFDWGPRLWPFRPCVAGVRRLGSWLPSGAQQAHTQQPARTARTTATVTPPSPSTDGRVGHQHTRPYTLSVSWHMRHTLLPVNCWCTQAGRPPPPMSVTACHTGKARRICTGCSSRSSSPGSPAAPPAASERRANGSAVRRTLAPRSLNEHSCTQQHQGTCRACARCHAGSGQRAGARLLSPLLLAPAALGSAVP